MMGRRRSMGSDPLDWVGETGGAHPRHENPQENDRTGWNGTETARQENPAEGGTMLPAVPSSTPYGMERQYLLVDGLLRDGGSRPKLNQVLWMVLFLLTFLGLGILFFQETRRQWRERIAGMEGTIERIEKEKGRNERILEQVISDKDVLIREKQGTLAKIESLHEGLRDELRTARSEVLRLKTQNDTLVKRFLDPPSRAAAGPLPAGAGLGSPAPAPAGDSQEPPDTK
jgi:hypothetical protein